MASSAILKSAFVAAATLVGLLDRTGVALAASLTPRCDVFQYYDVIAGACRHCDAACFEYENGTIVKFSEVRCFELCPDYIQEPRVPLFPVRPEDDVKMTLMEVALLGFIFALFTIFIVVAVILRSEIYTMLKYCCYTVKGMKEPSDVFGFSTTDISETSYVKLADPCDEVEIIDRVTCV